MMCNGTVGLNTLGAAEDQARQWNRMVSGATQGYTVLSGAVDQLMGSTGTVGDYLRSVRAVVNTSANSQVIVRVGVPAAKLGTLTVAIGTTASAITTSNNAAAVAADQYKDHIIKVGGVYRRILTHTAFSAAAANIYTLDHALAAVPANGGAIRIEDPQLVYELLPAGAASRDIAVDERSTGAGYYLSADTGVVLRCAGSFT